MPISRRDVLRLSVAGGGATALGGLIGSGVNLAPLVAEAQELRIAQAKVTPSVCPFCAVGCATLVHTVGTDKADIQIFIRVHNERNLAEYEGRTEIDDQLLADLIRCTKKLEHAVAKLSPPPEAKG